MKNSEPIAGSFPGDVVPQALLIIISVALFASRRASLLLTQLVLRAMLLSSVKSQGEAPIGFRDKYGTALRRDNRVQPHDAPLASDQWSVASTPPATVHHPGRNLQRPRQSDEPESMRSSLAV